MVLATFFAFPSTACYGVPNIVSFGDGVRLMTQFGGVLVSNSPCGSQSHYGDRGFRCALQVLS